MNPLAGKLYVPADKVSDTLINVLKDKDLFESAGHSKIVDDRYCPGNEISSCPYLHTQGSNAKKFIPLTVIRELSNPTVAGSKLDTCGDLCTRNLICESKLSSYDLI